MYKKKISLLLIFMLVLSLGAGCGKKTTGEADTQTGNTDVFTDSVERQCPYLLTGLPEGSKKITLSIVEGTFNFDAIEVK